jgi:hypothetical protein
LKNLKCTEIHCQVNESLVKKPLKMSGAAPYNITDNQSNVKELLVKVLQRLDTLESRVKKTSKFIKGFSKD